MVKQFQFEKKLGTYEKNNSTKRIQIFASNQDAIKQIDKEMKEFDEKIVDIVATNEVPYNAGNAAGEIAKQNQKD